MTLTVTPVNDAPLANDDSLAATEDTPVTFAAAQTCWATTATWTATA
ncbi:Ig-like domain-containing protein [Pseudomonas stutzeri]|nr:Ig-like domain-containing protein [Stutzerimonas stutzeri]